MLKKCYGILPMAGKGERIQPIAFSKELYPIIYQKHHFPISEFSVKGMINAGVDEIKLIVNLDKIDIPKYYSHYKNLISIYFYNSPSLPESCLYPLESIHDEDICLFGLPDTVYEPSDGLLRVRREVEKGADICLGLFKVKDGSKFDSVKLRKGGTIAGVLVKKDPPLSNWIWGIWGANGKALRILKKAIVLQKNKNEKLLGVGFNTVCKMKNIKMKAIKLSNQYFDIGTMESLIKLRKAVKGLNINI